MSLNYLDVEVGYGSQWISINDGERYKINGAETRDQTSKTFRKITADSIVLGGNYLVHAVPEMVTERIGVWVYGQDHADLSDNLEFLDTLFFQYDFRIRWTTEDYLETWRCQLADATISRGQVWTHNTMAAAVYNIPRYPEAIRERLM